MHSQVDHYVEAPLFFVNALSILLLGQYLAHQPIKKYGWVALLITIVILFPFFSTYPLALYRRLLPHTAIRN